MEDAIRWEFKLADAVNDQWAHGDLYPIIINWVAERQREGKLSDMWGSVQSFNGDKIISLHRNGMRNGPYIIIYDDRQPPPRYEAHKCVSQRLGWVEIVGKCDAADPKFFEILLNDMVGIQTADALDGLGEMHEC